MAFSLNQVSVSIYTYQPRAAAGDGAGNLCAVGADAPIYSSNDGATWTSGTRPSGPYITYLSVAYGSGRFVAVGDNSNSAIWSSNGGSTWTKATLPQTAQWQTIVWTGTHFVASAGSYFGTVNSYIAYSTDGSSWTQVSAPEAWSLLAESLVWNGSYCLILSKAGNRVYKSTDGITWTVNATTHSPDMVRIAWNGSVFCGLKYGTAVAATSSDGISWTDHALPATLNWTHVAWNGARFFGLAGESSTASYTTSFDGISWSSGTLPAARYWGGLGVSGTTLIGINPSGHYLVLGTGDSVPVTGAAALLLDIYCKAYGASGLPLEINSVGYGQPALTIDVSSIAAGVLSGGSPVTDGTSAAAVWGPVVYLDGADVTDSVIGDIVVEAEEGVARIADLTIMPLAGVIYLPDFVGASIVIAVADVSSGQPVNAMILFTGKVDLPSINLDDRVISLRCTDDFQNVVDQMSRAQLTTLVGGYWSPVIFDKGATAWTYYKDRSSTVSASVDLSPVGALRKTDWLAKSIPDMFFDASIIIDRSLSVALAERGALVNRVDVDFGYRIPKIKAEGYEVSYDIMALNQTSFGYWVRDGGAFLLRDQVLRAIESAGGKVVSISWIPLPTTAQIIPALGGGVAGAWLPNPVSDPLLCLGFSALVSFDYAQFVDESHLISVIAPNSIDQLGLLRSNMSGALEGQTVDAVASETSAVLYASGLTKIPPVAAATPVSGTTTSTSLSLTDETDRPAANAAMETLIAIAKTKIFLAHRQNSVGFSVPLNAALDLDKTVEISALGVSAKGKVSWLRHVMKTDSAEAITEVRLAICACSGVGIFHPEDATLTATTESPGSPAVLGVPVVTWAGAAGGDQSITIVFPGVEDLERQLAQPVFSRTVRAPIAEDVFSITL